jgi:hypothetical protein
LPRRSAATARQWAVGPRRWLGDFFAWRINRGLSPFFSGELIVVCPRFSFVFLSV